MSASRSASGAGLESIVLDGDWHVASAEPDACVDPAQAARLEWRAARVPGTVAGALGEQGRFAAGLDADDWWFRTRFDKPEITTGDQVMLSLEGIATLSDVYLNGARIGGAESMFVSQSLDVTGALEAENELAIRCRALTPAMRVRRKPRARWRTRLVDDGSLRWMRTQLLGRAPGFAPTPAAVGPWRPVSLQLRHDLALTDLVLAPSLDGDDGVVAIRARLRCAGSSPTAAELRVCEQGAALKLLRDGEDIICEGELRIPSVQRWWPHSHGEPKLHPAQLVLDDGVEIDCGSLGFRAVTAGASEQHDLLADGLDLHLNGAPLFARGAVWTPLDPVGLSCDPDALRKALESVRDAGMNMLRIPGTSSYESSTFHDLCDELGILVWQDLMFANLDYPFADPAFSELVDRELEELLGRVAGRPSTVMLCGNSEVEQQVGMLGLDPEAGRGEFFGQRVLARAREAGFSGLYVPSAPCGGALPFRADAGVANYYGVGGYRRPLADARLADVRFASECLAFANVPDDAALADLMPEAPQDLTVHHPRWKVGVPRDAGTGWDFDDVRDHYLRELHDVDPGELRRSDHDRYLELSRSVTGEVMASVFGEWRRGASRCSGGLVLWWRDLLPGAGWGILDHRGLPKVAYHHLRRALAPVATWMTDEGLGGLAVHVANDRPEPLSATLRLALFKDFEQPVGGASIEVELAAGAVTSFDAEALLGRFADISWSYRFGPPAQDLVVATLETPDRRRSPGAQAFAFPVGRPRGRESAQQLGVDAQIVTDDDGALALEVKSRRLLFGVRLDVTGYRAIDDAFCVEPGGCRTVGLEPDDPPDGEPRGSLSALNLSGSVPVTRRAAQP